MAEPMDRIYANSEEKFLLGTIVYAGDIANDAYLYSDSECTKKIPGLELMGLFYTGLFIADKGRMYRPSYMEAETPDSVSIHVVSEDTAGAITIAYYAAEHTPEET